MFFRLACLVVQQCRFSFVFLDIRLMQFACLQVCRLTLIFRYCRFSPRSPCIAVDLDCSLFDGGGSSKMNIEFEMKII